jgi:glycosyltransferase involved in cell wall biosynthesis
MSTVDTGRRKPVVLVLASYYLPGYRAGGPVRSLSNVIEALGDEFEFHVLTRDRDLNESTPYRESAKGGEVRMGKAAVRYLRPGALVPWRIRRIAHALKPDLLYHNSFFDPLFTVLPLWLRRFGTLPTPVLIAPRGEFSTGALGLKSLKKKVYLGFSKGLGVVGGLQWHATGEAEREDIIRMMGARLSGIWVAPNIGRTVDRDGAQRDRVDHTFSVAFVSRVSPMKNLVQAIRIVRSCTTPIRFDIYGPIGDEAYWNDCRLAIADSPSHVAISYQGPIENERVAEVLRKYDAFLLPSLGENYGHAIVEALAAGLPVVISDRTPWRGLREAGAGYDLPLQDEKAFVLALESLASRSSDEKRRTREAVLAYAEKIHSASDAVDRTRAMLLAAIGPGQTP